MFCCVLTMYKVSEFLRWKKMEERVEICFSEIKEYNNNKIYIVFARYLCRKNDNGVRDELHESL